MDTAAITAYIELNSLVRFGKPVVKGTRHSTLLKIRQGKKRGGPTFGVPTQPNPFRPVKQRLIAKITTVLQQLSVVRNLARQKFVSQFSSVLIKSCHIPFCEVAQHLNDVVKLASNETRIQDFFRKTQGFQNLKG